MNAVIAFVWFTLSLFAVSFGQVGIAVGCAFLCGCATERAMQ